MTAGSEKGLGDSRTCCAQDQRGGSGPSSGWARYEDPSSLCRVDLTDGSVHDVFTGKPAGDT